MKKTKFMRGLEHKIKNLKLKKTPRLKDSLITKPIIKIRNFIYSHPDWSVFLFTLFIGILSANYFYHKGLITAYGDASSHLNIARRVVDSLTPGFAQLGNSWLPFIHVSYLPFIWNDFLWYTGLAGTIPTVIYFAIACTFLYKLTAEFWNDRKAGLLAVFVFITIPSVLYFAVVPMFEMPFMMTVILSTYFFYKYIETNKYHFLAIAGFFTGLAGFTWYPGWAMPPVFLLILILKILIEDKKTFSDLIKNFKQSLVEKWDKVEGFGLIYAIPAFSGIVGWLIWNWILWGNPIDFLINEWSAGVGSTTNVLASTSLLELILTMGIAIEKYFIASCHMVGVPLVIYSLIGFIFLIICKQKSTIEKLSVIGLLSFSAIFLFVLIFVTVKYIVIPELDNGWFNVRYALPTALFIAVFSSSLIVLIKNKFKFFGTILLCILIFFGLTNLTQGFLQNDQYPLRYPDALYYIKNRLIECPDLKYCNPNKKNLAAEFLRNNYDGGKILLTIGDLNYLIRESRISFKEIICEANKGEKWNFYDVLKAPWNYTGWIIMHHPSSKNIVHLDYVTLRWGNSTLLFKFYDKVYDDGDIMILRRNNQSLENLSIYLKKGYFEIENITYFENKLQFRLVNYLTVQPKIDILLKCKEIPEAEFPLHIENMTNEDSMVITMPVVQGCKNLNLSVKGRWYEYEKTINITALNLKKLKTN